MGFTSIEFELSDLSVTPIIPDLWKYFLEVNLCLPGTCRLPKGKENIKAVISTLYQDLTIIWLPNLRSVHSPTPALNPSLWQNNHRLTNTNMSVSQKQVETKIWDAYLVYPSPVNGCVVFFVSCVTDSNTRSWYNMNIDGKYTVKEQNHSQSSVNNLNDMVSFDVLWLICRVLQLVVVKW